MNSNRLTINRLIPVHVLQRGYSVVPCVCQCVTLEPLKYDRD